MKPNLPILFLIFATLVSTCMSQNSNKKDNLNIQCVDENNNPVDWIIFYKLPRMHYSSKNPLIMNGEAYMHISSANVRQYEQAVKERENNKKSKVSNKTGEDDFGGEKFDVRGDRFGETSEAGESRIEGVGISDGKLTADAKTKEEMSSPSIKKNGFHINTRKTNGDDQNTKLTQEEQKALYDAMYDDNIEYESVMDEVKAFDKANAPNVPDFEYDMGEYDLIHDAINNVEHEDVANELSDGEPNNDHFLSGIPQGDSLVDFLRKKYAKNDSPTVKKNPGDFNELNLLDSDSDDVNEKFQYYLPALRAIERSKRDVSRGQTDERRTSERASQTEKSRTSASLQWILSNISVTDENSLPSKIISPYLFANKDQFAQDGVRILYNDQTPTSTTVAFGHSKGMVLGNSGGGVWIVHSIPHFIDDSQPAYNYPHTGLMYGQNFMCLSLNSSELDYIGHNLGHNQIYMYSTFLSDNNKETYKTLSQVIAKKYVTSNDNFFKSTIYTKFNGIPFQTFAKTRELHDDLYKYMSNSLSVNLAVESWPNGPGRLPSNCKSPANEVENVEAISVPGVLDFHSTHDHSKWTISFKNATASAGRKNSQKIVGKSISNRDGKTETNAQRGEDIENFRASNDDRNFYETIAVDANNNMKSNKRLVVNNQRKQKRDLSALFSLIFDSSEDSLAQNKISQDLHKVAANKQIGALTATNEDEVILKHLSDIYNKNDDLRELIERSNEIDIGEPHYSDVAGINDGVESTKGMHSLDLSRDNFVNGDSSLSADPTSDADETYHYVCNGDINRAEDQMKRGGGSVCMNNEVVWTLYHELISSVEPCPRT